MGSRFKGKPSALRLKQANKERHKVAGSTPGRSKCARCKASKDHRTLARRSRSYKRKDYEDWADRMVERNKPGN